MNRINKPTRPCLGLRLTIKKTEELRKAAIASAAATGATKVTVNNSAKSLGELACMSGSDVVGYLERLKQELIDLDPDLYAAQIYKLDRAIALYDRSALLPEG